jgi:hypothetical protein
MQGRTGNQHHYKGYSQLAAIRVENIDDSLEVSVLIESYLTFVLILVVWKLFLIRRDTNYFDPREKLMFAIRLCS